MPIDLNKLLRFATQDVTVRYDDRDSILYALGIGFGRDPLNPQELPFVSGKTPKAVPTLATVLGGHPHLEAALGLDAVKVVHGEQRLRLMQPLPAAASVIIGQRVIGAYDKGRDKGALVLLEKHIRDARTGETLCTLVSGLFARGDGGFGGPRDGAPLPHSLPAREPDLIVETDTRPDQALLYALSGDRNPLHVDPAFAREAGFSRPILHGLCTYGTACRAIITSVCQHDATRILAFDARFTSPVYPGEALHIEMWIDGRLVSFRARAAQRDQVVLDNGRCELAF